MSAEDGNVQVVCTGFGRHGQISVSYITSWLESDGTRTLMDREFRDPGDRSEKALREWRRNTLRPFLFRGTPQKSLSVADQTTWHFECRKCGYVEQIPNSAVNEVVSAAIARGEWLIDLRDPKNAPRGSR